MNFISPFTINMYTHLITTMNAMAQGPISGQTQPAQERTVSRLITRLHGLLYMYVYTS